MLTSWLRGWFRPKLATIQCRRVLKARNRRPLVELLEDRCVPSATLVKDINLTSTGPANPQSLFSLNGAALFSADDKLWGSDGTAAGTAMIKDLGTATGQ